MADLEKDIQGADHLSRVRRLNHQAFGKKAQKIKVSTVFLIIGGAAALVFIMWMGYQRILG